MSDREPWGEQLRKLNEPAPVNLSRESPSSRQRTDAPVPPLTAEERATLKTLCEKATAGPWRVFERLICTTDITGHADRQVVSPRWSDFTFEEDDANAAFIAAANPATVARLLASLEQMERRLAEAASDTQRLDAMERVLERGSLDFARNNRGRVDLSGWMSDDDNDLRPPVIGVGSNAREAIDKALRAALPDPAAAVTKEPNAEPLICKCGAPLIRNRPPLQHTYFCRDFCDQFGPASVPPQEESDE